MFDNHTLKTRILPMLLLVAVTFCVFLPSLGFDFVPSWDDDLYVTANESAQGFSIQNLKVAFSSIYGGNYAPVQIISYMLDYTFWGMNPAGYHASNILIHTINGILLFNLLIRLGLSRTAAYFAATIFLIHPVQVESVVWISQRKNVLSLFFMLVSFHYYLNFRNFSGGKNRFLYYFASFIFAILALLSKSVAVIIPFLFILHDFCFSPEKSWKKHLLSLAPFLVAAACAGAATIIFQHGDHGGGRLSIRVSPLVVALTMPGVFLSYLDLLFFPTTHKLCNIYLPKIHASFNVDEISGYIAFLFLVLIGIRLFRRNRPLFFWYAAAWLAFLPVSQIVPLATLMNDRYLYVPMVGIAPLVVVTICSLCNRLKLDRYALVILAGMCIAAGAVSCNRLDVWKNDYTLWSDAFKKHPHDYQAITVLGNALLNRGDEAEALALFRKAFSLKPDYAPLLKSLGEYYLKKGDYLIAREYFHRFILSSPRNAAAFERYGLACKQAGDLAEAETAFLKAVELEPTISHAPLHLSNLYLSRGDIPAARRFIAISITNGLGKLEAAYESACIEAQAGNDDLAITHLEQAVQLGLSDPEILRRDPFLAPLRKNSTQFESVIRSIIQQ